MRGSKGTCAQKVRGTPGAPCLCCLVCPLQHSPRALPSGPSLPNYGQALSPMIFFIIIIPIVLSLFILRETERKSTSRGGAERGGRTEDREAGSTWTAESPMWGSNSRTPRSRPEPTRPASLRIHLRMFPLWSLFLASLVPEAPPKGTILSLGLHWTQPMDTQHLFIRFPLPTIPPSMLHTCVPPMPPPESHARHPPRAPGQEGRGLRA